jgi:hypothetical protein
LSKKKDIFLKPPFALFYYNKFFNKTKQGLDRISWKRYFINGGGKLNKKVIIGIGTGIVVAGIIVAAVAMRSTGPSGQGGGIIPTKELGSWENPVPLGHPLRIKSPLDGEFELTVENFSFEKPPEYGYYCTYEVSVRIKAITETGISVWPYFCLIDINGKEYVPNAGEPPIILAPGGVETRRIEWSIPRKENAKIIRMSFRDEKTYYFALA